MNCVYRKHWVWLESHLKAPTCQLDMWIVKEELQQFSPNVYRDMFMAKDRIHWLIDNALFYHHPTWRKWYTSNEYHVRNCNCKCQLVTPFTLFRFDTITLFLDVLTFSTFAFLWPKKARWRPNTSPFLSCICQPTMSPHCCAGSWAHPAPQTVCPRTPLLQSTRQIPHWIVPEILNQISKWDWIANLLVLSSLVFVFMLQLFVIGSPRVFIVSDIWCVWWTSPSTKEWWPPNSHKPAIRTTE
jgi:hypothetical protein